MPSRSGNHPSTRPTRLTEAMVVAWADHHRTEDGQWPSSNSGEVKGAAGENWNKVDAALRDGYRGLPGGDTLAKLLRRERGPRVQKYRLKIDTIVRWAKEHHTRTGEWPTRHSGPVEGHPPFTWLGLNHSLIGGWRGLPGGTTLSKVLARHCKTPHRRIIQTVTDGQILRWADAHHARTGKWPRMTSGMVKGAHPPIGWIQIDTALKLGRFGAAPGTTLTQFLVQRRQIKAHKYQPRLTHEQILAWADAHQARTGRWPTRTAGTVPEAPDENWQAIGLAVDRGTRGLPKGWTLTTLLREKRGPRPAPPDWTVGQVLTWAAAHKARTGKRASRLAGAIPEAPGTSWTMVDEALKAGRRGLPGGTTLSKFLAEHGLV